MAAQNAHDDVSFAVDRAPSTEGLLSRRVIAFMIDYLLLGAATVALFLGIAIFGLVTFTLGWALFFAWGPLVAAVIFAYAWVTLGGQKQATVGMRAVGIKLARLDGGRIDGLTGMVHTALFWLGNVVLTPLILLAVLFTDRQQTLHDLLLGTVVVRADAN